MSRYRRLTLLAVGGRLLSFFFWARLFAVAGPNEYRTVHAVVAMILLIASGWLTGRAGAARRRGE